MTTWDPATLELLASLALLAILGGGFLALAFLIWWIPRR